MSATKDLCFTHHELLELIAIVRSLKNVAEQKNDTEEVQYMQELIEALLTFDFDKHHVYLTLENMTCFGLWLCLEPYIEFCKQSDQQDELDLAETLRAKLAA